VNGKRIQGIYSKHLAGRKELKELGKHVNMGLAYGELGRYKKAAVSLKRAIALEPDDAEIRFGLGVALFLSGDKGAALRQCLKLRGIDRKLGYELYSMIKAHPTPQL